MAKSRMRWAGHFSRMGKRYAYGGFVGRKKKTDHYEDLDVDARIILKCILGIEDSVVWTGFIWLTTGSLACSYEHNNESSVS
jgi:hypothetical protein